MLKLLQKLIHAFHGMICARLAICHCLFCVLTDKPEVHLLMALLYFLMAVLYLLLFVKG